MGRDKALLPWVPPGFTLLDHVTHLLASVCHPVFIVGRQIPLLVKEGYREPASWLPDRVPGIGPLGGLSSALHQSQSENNIVIAVDLPFLTSDFLKYFKERCHHSSRPLTVCKIESAFPLCLGIRTDFRNIVDEYVASGSRSVQGLIEANNPEIISVNDLLSAGFSTSIFTNINTLTDYQLAIKTINRDTP
jgi:molybdopterin-guanine dinucleotide biosynthesis protein A